MGKLHYADAPELRRVVALVYSGPNAVKKVREIAGPTNPHVAREKSPGTIRTLGTLVQLKDADGKPAGDRIDNLVHASATDAEAEREIKLWFKPNDIMPYMHAYATEAAPCHYYYKAGRLLTAHEPGCVCLFAPGDTAWKSDLDALCLIQKGQPSACSLDSVAAKYLINERREV
jgi:nucleoside-diphosphate kinase